MAIIRDSIKSSLIPTVDAAKTVGIVSLPGMMSGLILPVLIHYKRLNTKLWSPLC